MGHSKFSYQQKCFNGIHRYSLLTGQQAINCNYWLLEGIASKILTASFRIRFSHQRLQEPGNNTPVFAVMTGFNFKGKELAKK